LHINKKTYIISFMRKIYTRPKARVIKLSGMPLLQETSDDIKQFTNLAPKGYAGPLRTGGGGAGTGNHGGVLEELSAPETAFFE
jgi:hypothetical protein